MTEITEFNKDNADIEDFIQKSAGNYGEIEQSKDADESKEAGKETCQFPAYKEDPIML